jgi:hypothetical protein
MESKTPYNRDRFQDGDTFNHEGNQQPLMFRDLERERALDEFSELMEHLRKKIEE